MTRIQQLLSSCLYEISQSNSTKRLEDIRIAVFGRNGKFADLMADLRQMSPDDKKSFGAEINAAKSEIQKALSSKIASLELKELENKMKFETLDVTLPGRTTSFGTLHPLTKVTEEVANILSGYGFFFAKGPDIESEYYNFNALNIPDYHPARTMHDTFYLNYPSNDEGRKLLRTHTSPVQVRTMLAHAEPPLRCFSIGRVYRSDYDATHTPMFNQIEGLAVGEDISFAHLKYLLTDFLQKFFEVPDVTIRLRPSFFPFTEPSVEVDMQYEIKNGKMLFGTGDKWLEVAGGGMVHPHVLRSGKIDPEKYSGFAFGFGLERLTSLKYGVSDLRGYFESDARWRDSYNFEHVAI